MRESESVCVCVCVCVCVIQQQNRQQFYKTQTQVGLLLHIHVLQAGLIRAVFLNNKPREVHFAHIRVSRCTCMHTHKKTCNHI